MKIMLGETYTQGQKTPCNFPGKKYFVNDDATCRLLFRALCRLQPYPDEAHRCWALPPAFYFDLGLGIFTIKVMCCID